MDMQQSNHAKFRQNANTKIEKFWADAIMQARSDKLRHFNLPLARIKRLMKIEEDVKMVASEVPILFSKVTEKFVEELTLRAWINTEENKRRILQKNDLGFAARTCDVFDFLIYIVPRNEQIIGLDRFEPSFDEGKEILHNE